MNDPNYEPLWYWVREREAIRRRKEVELLRPPFTDDPILATYRFCNVRREDDRVTRWVRANIRDRYPDHTHLWFMLAISRWINWPDTLQELIGSIEPGRAWPSESAFSLATLNLAIQHRADRGEKVFTGAYTINAPAEKGASKIDYVCNTVLGELWHARDRADLLRHCSLKSAHAWFRGFQGWGDFMAYQVVVDLRFTRYLENAPDVASWAAAGPGTIRGLNRIYGRSLNEKIAQPYALSEMKRIYERAFDATGVAMDFSDVPNILCETDKYLRVKNGEGKPRALYVPGRGS